MQRILPYTKQANNQRKKTLIFVFNVNRLYKSINDIITCKNQKKKLKKKVGISSILGRIQIKKKRIRNTAPPLPSPIYQEISCASDGKALKCTYRI